MWKVSRKDVERLQLEITTFCNADCPSCERNQERNDSYVIPKLNSTHLSVEKITKWFDLDFENLETVHLCGNIDEPIMHPDVSSIIDFFSKKVKKNVLISTNGFARDKKFWKSLAKNKKLIVIWGLDGLEDTNHIYRRNLKWNRIQRNFEIFNNNGGNSIWQFIVFDHNSHQIEDAKKYSKINNFKLFNTIFSNRENKNVIPISKKKQSINNIVCKSSYSSSELQKSFFINSLGYVFPCCWMATSKSIQDIKDIFGVNIFTENNLEIQKFDDIIEGHFFDSILNNFNKISCCNRMCKQNLTDIKEYHES